MRIHSHSRSEVGSSGRTRTCNPPVTSAPVFLPGLDYLFTCPTEVGWRCRALARHYWMGSSASSLCTFLLTIHPSAGFAQGSHSEAVRGRVPWIHPMFQPQFPVEAATLYEFLDGNLRVGIYPLLGHRSRCLQPAALPDWATEDYGEGCSKGTPEC